MPFFADTEEPEYKKIADVLYEHLSSTIDVSLFWYWKIVFFLHLIVFLLVISCLYPPVGVQLVLHARGLAGGRGGERAAARAGGGARGRPLRRARAAAARRAAAAPAASRAASGEARHGYVLLVLRLRGGPAVGVVDTSTMLTVAHENRKWQTSVGFQCRKYKVTYFYEITS